MAVYEVYEIQLASPAALTNPRDMKTPVLIGAGVLVALGAAWWWMRRDSEDDADFDDEEFGSSLPLTGDTSSGGSEGEAIEAVKRWAANKGHDPAGITFQAKPSKNGFKVLGTRGSERFVFVVKPDGSVRRVKTKKGG